MADNNTEWTTFTRRTDDPKLAWLEQRLAEYGIPSRRNGYSAHGPILEIHEYDRDRAWQILTFAIDEMDDDDPMFFTIDITGEVSPCDIMEYQDGDY